MPGSNGVVLRPELWDLPTDGRDRFFKTMGRALTRRCPYCGSPGIFEGYFALRDACPRCGVRFNREEGYFLGGYAINLIVAEILAISLAILLIFGTALRDMGLLAQEAVILSLALFFPIVFFPYSRGVWMALDLTLHPPDPAAERRRRSRSGPYDIDNLN